MEITFETFVIHVGNDVPLTRAVPPSNLPEFGVHEPYLLSASLGWSLPSERSSEMQKIFKDNDATDAEVMAYSEWHCRQDSHQMLGHCYYEHYDDRYMAAAATEGYGIVEMDEATIQKREEWRTDAPNWRCLLQIGSESSAHHEGATFDIQWGNRGCIYLVIDESDLQARNFGQVIAL